MDLNDLFSKAFTQSLLLTVVSAVLPLLATHLTKHFGWRASLRKDAELYAFLRDIAGDNVSKRESEVLRVLRTRVFEHARSHTIEHSELLRLYSKGFLVLLYAPLPATALGLILQAIGYPKALQLLSDYARWIVIAILLFGTIMVVWSIADWYRWSKARDSLSASSDSFINHKQP